MHIITGWTDKTPMDITPTAPLGHNPIRGEGRGGKYFQINLWFWLYVSIYGCRGYGCNVRPLRSISEISASLCFFTFFLNFENVDFFFKFLVVIIQNQCDPKFSSVSI